MTTTLSCLHCGDSLAPGSRFCAQCGLEVLDEAASYEGDGSSPWMEVVQRLQSATLGEFEIGRELGRGAMAAVFLAHDIALDRKVAIKVMSPGLLMGEGMIERFKREAITIAHLNHPNIVSVYSVRQAEGLHFFIMRYIHGRSLEQVIHQAGKLPVPIVRSIFCQVGSALTYAHRSGVVHRDIKPANILIDEDGNAVVTDFGIAKVAQLPSDTHSGALVGTPAYMSPEQCSGAEVSGASDQYALGAVAYEMLTGQVPFTGSTLTVMQAHVAELPLSIRELRADCPAEVEAAIFRMLAKDPADRWATMAEAKTALGATPLGEEDPLLAELRRLANPDRDSSPGLLAAADRPPPQDRPSSTPLHLRVWSAP
jgi:serine/threonine protein kinase